MAVIVTGVNSGKFLNINYLGIKTTVFSCLYFSIG